MKKKLSNPLLGAVTGLAIITAGGIAKAHEVEKQCEPVKPGEFRLGHCGGNRGAPNNFELPYKPSTFGLYNS